MNYKGYNIALHELGHNVEQVLSFNRIDHTILRGVPNNAFTEAFAMVFQSHDLDLLGLSQSDPNGEALIDLDDLWSTYEIAGVALVDMAVWHWMYDHPEAAAPDLKAAVLDISRAIWNRYYAPVFGKKDVILLAVYSHMIDNGLYLPDYPLGHLIAFQIGRKLEGSLLGVEMERMCKLGSIAPDVWMHAAAGSAVSATPLLDAAERALGKFEKISSKKM
jgi:oligoendopeptidase F